MSIAVNIRDLLLPGLIRDLMNAGLSAEQAVAAVQIFDRHADDIAARVGSSRKEANRRAYLKRKARNAPVPREVHDVF